MTSQDDKDAIVSALLGITKPKVRSLGGSVGVQQFEDWWCHTYKVHVLDPRQRLRLFELRMLELIKEGRVRYADGQYWLPERQKEQFKSPGGSLRRKLPDDPRQGSLF